MSYSWLRQFTCAGCDSKGVNSDGCLRSKNYVVIYEKRVECLGGGASVDCVVIYKKRLGYLGGGESVDCVVIYEGRVECGDSRGSVDYGGIYL